MPRTRISANFLLDEFTVSSTAARHGISNKPSAAHLANIKKHLAPGLEKARVILGNRPIIITSAYRNKKVNDLVGGTPTSAHPQGLAADIRVSGLDSLTVAHRLADSGLKFDQLILESSRKIVHLSFDPRFRGQVLTQAGGPGTKIVNGLPPIKGGKIKPIDAPDPVGFTIDRAHFKANFPSSKLFGATLKSKSRREGFDAIFDAWDAVETLDSLEWLAYALATAWHETGGRMQPVREGFAKSDEAAYKAVTAYCKKKGISNYAARHSNGNSYYGRGYVQLTHASNYKKASAQLKMGTSLYDVPDLVMEPRTGAQILLEGMIEGWFRPGKGTLITYFNSQETDWIDARDLINGDKRVKPKWAGGKTIGRLVGDYGKAFRGALKFE